MYFYQVRQTVDKDGFCSLSTLKELFASSLYRSSNKNVNGALTKEVQQLYLIKFYSDWENCFDNSGILKTLN